MFALFFPEKATLVNFSIQNNGRSESLTPQNRVSAFWSPAAYIMAIWGIYDLDIDQCRNPGKVEVTPTLNVSMGPQQNMRMNKEANLNEAHG